MYNLVWLISPSVDSAVVHTHPELCFTCITTDKHIHYIAMFLDIMLERDKRIVCIIEMRPFCI